MSKYIAYYRASTEEQRDGLGLDAQRDACHRFVERFGGDIVEEIEEIISGGARIREGFDRAVSLCEKHGHILLVHRIDRLSRGGFATLATLEEKGIPFIEADSPHDSVFSKNIKFLVAKEEKEKIQTRVKDALGQIKKKIEKDGYYISKQGNKITTLGSPQNMTDEARRKSARIRKAQALSNENNRKAWAVIRQMRNNSSYKQMAEYLNKNGFTTSRGNKFYPTQVGNLIKMYDE